MNTALASMEASGTIPPVAITNREFNGTACEQAKLLNVKLLERKALSEELDRLQIPVSVLDECLLRVGITQ